MKSMWIKNNWIYGVLLVSVISAIFALLTSNFIFKSGTAGIGILIILILNFKKVKPSKATWFIIGAFLFSIAGDWFMSNMNGDSTMFSKGIALFFLAHLGYLLFATLNGQIKWRFTSILLALFLLFYFLVLFPSINDNILMFATLIYLLISCFSLGASVGIKGDYVVKWTYVFGIFLILFSDTIISLTEFLGYNRLDFLILPTYYLAHISITFSLIRKQG
ncbi:MAG: lysoplasmalogenase family protein [Maribacter arcticus]|uniref:lysoplasmalogenase family protein n=1 Tax=Maribacter arcticus TaxID=561365 RepID=UPI003001DAEB